jgi:citrate lyase subunit beta/citryl-CoA lyase
MVNTSEEVSELDEILSQAEVLAGLETAKSVVLLVETPLGVINAYSMATASERVVGMMFGAEDFLLETQGRCDEEETVLHTPRALIAMAARAAGVEAIDTPYVEVHDLQGLESHAQRGCDLGMSGMLVLSPRQIPIAHQVFTPSLREVEDAREVVRISEETRRTGRSYAVVDGKVVSPSREKRARMTLARMIHIKRLERWSSNQRAMGE